jgi:hypothetical protein
MIHTNVFLSNNIIIDEYIFNNTIFFLIWYLRIFLNFISMLLPTYFIFKLPENNHNQVCRWKAIWPYVKRASMVRSAGKGANCHLLVPLCVSVRPPVHM